MHDTALTRRRPQPGEPAWEIAELHPAQGDWTVEDYLALDTNRPIEYTDGYLEFLPMPTELHQFIVIFLFDALRRFVGPRRLGTVLLAPLRIRIAPRKFREPDVVFMLAEHASRRSNAYWDRADLVMEVVSEDDPQRDREKKRLDYAAARIPEYWIVDPQRREIIVLVLAGKRYRTHGVFRPRQRATSVLLPGFAVGVSAVFKAAEAAAK